MALAAVCLKPMSTILAISSYVVRGHIGLGAVVPALNGLGYDVTALPTVLYSSHPGHRHHACHDVSAKTLANMLDALNAQGGFGETPAILTGYLPHADHVAVAARAVRRVKALNPDAIYLCDPVLGDDPKGLYLDRSAASAVRDTLVPIADILKPNRFELEWLTDQGIGSVRDAISAANTLEVPTVLVTSLPDVENRLANLLISDGTCWSASVPLLAHVPHGTGDMMGALTLAYRLKGFPMPEVLSRSTASINAVVRCSAGLDELALAANLDAWLDPAEPIPVVLSRER